MNWFEFYGSFRAARINVNRILLKIKQIMHEPVTCIEVPFTAKLDVSEVETDDYRRN